MSTASKSTDWGDLARHWLGGLAKTPGSLGYLEDLAARLVEIQGTLTPSLSRKRLCLFAASHGVTPAEVIPTASGQLAHRLTDFLSGATVANLLAAHVGASLSLIDVGVHADRVIGQRGDFFDRRVRQGTRNFLEEEAMTAEELLLAQAAGREQAQLAKNEGIELLAVGEIGSGSALSASVLYCALMGLPPKIVIGESVGVGREETKQQIKNVQLALKKHASCRTAAEWMRAVGGYDIAAMAGLIIEAAQLRRPVIVDGFVASAAALVALRLAPRSLEVCFFAQESTQQSQATVLPLLDGRPILHLGINQGEGTGALLAMVILEAAAKLMSRCQ